MISTLWEKPGLRRVNAKHAGGSSLSTMTALPSARKKTAASFSCLLPFKLHKEEICEDSDTGMNMQFQFAPCMRGVKEWFCLFLRHFNSRHYSRGESSTAMTATHRLNFNSRPPHVGRQREQVPLCRLSMYFNSRPCAGDGISLPSSSPVRCGNTRRGIVIIAYQYYQGRVKNF